VLAPAAECGVPGFRSRHLVGALAESGAQQPPFDADEAARRRAAVAATLTTVRALLTCLAPLVRSRASPWILQHHVPFEEMGDGALLVLGCLTLRWPYTAEAASCPNARVLERVAALLAAGQ
jgi:hypothetical protein